LESQSEEDIYAISFKNTSCAAVFKVKEKEFRVFDPEKGKEVRRFGIDSCYWCPVDNQFIEIPKSMAFHGEQPLLTVSAFGLYIALCAEGDIFVHVSKI